MNEKMSYEERKQAKIDYAKTRAAQLKRSSDRFFSKGFCETTGIPMGQPILVGHHSEKRHRAAIKRYENAMSREINNSEKSKYYEEKAKRLENDTVISSDDPTAVVKLKEKMQKLEESIAYSKEMNAKLRKFKTKANALKEVAKMPDEDKSKKIFLGMLGQCDYYAFPPDRISAYYLNTTLKNAEVRRIKKRIAQLQKLNQMEEIEEKVNDIVLKTDKDDNRVKLFFDGKPSQKVRTKLKSNGFRWSRFNGCWQRQLNEWGVRIAREVMAEVSE